jgi:hypothetical protein
MNQVVQTEPIRSQWSGEAQVGRRSAAPDAATHRTIIWIVVDGRHRVLVRSVRGDRGRWYREALANPDCTVWIGHELVPVRAIPASDPERVASTSAALTEKYAADPALRSMLRDDVLATTLELLPR